MLHSSRLFLRAPEPSDLDFLYRFENETALWPVSLSLAPFSREVLRQYLENALADIYSARQLRLMVCQQQEKTVLGTVDLYDFEPLHQRAGVGIALAPEYQKLGYGRETLQLLLSYAASILQLHQLHCTVAQENTVSLKLFREAGFEEVGVRREWLRTPQGWKHVVEFQKLLSSAGAQPV